MAIADILNYVQLTPRVGTSGQPTAEQLKDIASAGYQAVVNLALPTSDNALPDEAGHVTRLRLAYFQIPVLFDAPRVEELRTFVGLMRVLEDRPVWVHCAMNLRVSAFMYHYLRHDLGVPEARARSPVLAKWEPRMDAVWRAFLALGPEQLALPKRTE
jgi:protein tyrosine phosphatase (PTP) superfamily phosphohydrolase (DUF442 family)